MQVLANSPVRKVYVIRSQPTNCILNAKHDGRPYLIGFLNTEQAETLCRRIDQDSKVEFVDYSPQSFSIVRVEKKININHLPCVPMPMQFQEFMSLPYKQQLGVMFSFDIIDEDKQSFVLETQTYDPKPNISYFRQTLKNVGSQ